VLEIHTNRYDGVNRRINLHDLRIAGTFAHKLPGPDLYKEMLKLKVPGLDVSMGWQELATRLGVWQQQQQEAADAVQG